MTHQRPSYEGLDRFGPTGEAGARAAALGEASGEVNGEDLTAEEPLILSKTCSCWRSGDYKRSDAERELLCVDCTRTGECGESHAEEPDSLCDRELPPE
jgi:hypothetical protein